MSDLDRVFADIETVIEAAAKAEATAYLHIQHARIALDVLRTLDAARPSERLDKLLSDLRTEVITVRGMARDGAVDAEGVAYVLETFIAEAERR